MPSTITPDPPRLEAENDAWYSRLCVYVHLAKRSVLAVYTEERRRKWEKTRRKLEKAGKRLEPFIEPTACPSEWNGEKGKPKLFHWAERAAEWDAAERERKAQEWAAARDAERQAELEDAALLRERGRTHARIPIVTVSTPDGGTVEGNPQAARLAKDMLADAAKLARAALEMSSERVVVNENELNREIERELARVAGRSAAGNAGAPKDNAGSAEPAPDVDTAPDADNTGW